MVSGDAGYTGVEKRAEHAGRAVIWQIAVRRVTYKQLSKRSPLYKAKRKIKKAKARVRAKVEHPFRVIKRQFGYPKVRFRGLAKHRATGHAVCPVEPGGAFNRRIATTAMGRCKNSGLKSARNTATSDHS